MSKIRMVSKLYKSSTMYVVVVVLIKGSQKITISRGSLFEPRQLGEQYT